MKGFGSAGTSDGRASPDGFIRLIPAEIWMAHPRGPKEMKYEVSALIKRINRLYGPYTRETASSDNYTIPSGTPCLEIQRSDAFFAGIYRGVSQAFH